MRVERGRYVISEMAQKPVGRAGVDELRGRFEKCIFEFLGSEDLTLLTSLFYVGRDNGVSKAEGGASKFTVILGSTWGSYPS